jgi:glycosyltransferase involved in cell wall biosynthesis
MKVLYVIPSYEPAWTYGGTVTATSNLCRALAKQGVDVTVYTTDADGKGEHLNVPLNKPVDLGGVKVLYFHCDFGVKRAFYSRGLARKLNETVKDFDLVHVSAIWQWIGADVYKYCKMYSKPYLVSTHGSLSPWPWSQSFVKKRIYWHIFGMKTIKKTSAIHFTTNDERDKSLSTVPILSKKQSFIVPNGIVIKRGKNIRNNLNIKDEQFLLLFTGRIHRKKGIHFIIEALRKLKNNRLTFLIVGHEEDSEYVNHLKEISKELAGDVIWKESVNADYIWDYYSSSELFVLPSYDENFGMVVVEAMACGLPVLISKNVGLWHEVQADNAGFVVNQDVDEIASVLKRISDNPELLKQMSEHARKSAENRYDINKVASLMIKAYEDVLTERRSPELQWR